MKVLLIVVLVLLLLYAVDSVQQMRGKKQIFSPHKSILAALYFPAFWYVKKYCNMNNFVVVTLPKETAQKAYDKVKRDKENAEKGAKRVQIYGKPTKKYKKASAGNAKKKK